MSGSLAVPASVSYSSRVDRGERVGVQLVSEDCLRLSRRGVGSGSLRNLNSRL